jgi:hypothetical protein
MFRRISMTGPEPIREVEGPMESGASDCPLIPCKTVDWSYRVALWLLVGGTMAETVLQRAADGRNN